MQTWSITLYGPAGVISAVDTGESQFVIGMETASDVFTVHGEGVAERHAWVWISEAGLQVEDLGGGTLVNGYQITERVQVEYPASVQVGDVTLVIEVKAVQPVAVSPTPSSMDITMPQRAVTKSKASMEVTIPQRTPTRGNVQKIASTGTPSAQSDSKDKASSTSEYTLVREIARGGMGQIYFGEDPQLKRNVAVKVSSVSEAGEDPRFSKEAEVLAQLAHPNIVPIYNIGVDAQSRPFYSMKLIKGRTLQAVLNQIRDGDAAALKDYPRATLLTIFRKVCDAMMFAHSKGILHRDLKPENIMVGEYGEVLVMDWGLAKVLGEREEQASSSSRVNDTGDYGMTMEGEVMGTPQYMSPEQAMGMVAELDARSDIYSLGGILYAILTLRPPIDGTTLDEVLTKVKNGSISSMVTKRVGKGAVTVGSPTAMGAEVPEALQAVTLKAMATDRNKRYGSVEKFAADIEAYQNGFATQAEDAGALKLLLLSIKRNKAVSSLVAVFLLAAIGFTIRFGIEKEQARASEKRAIAQMEKSRRAAAEANMSLAEAAEAASDSVALRQALDAVPEDLRTRDWNYLQSRIDTATYTLEAPNGTSWVGFDDWPSEPERMVALRSDGELFAVNVNTGALQALWKFKPKGAVFIGPIGVSADGKRVAVAYSKTDETVVDVCSLETGEREGGIPKTIRGRHSEVIVSDELCVFRFTGLAGKSNTECWDWRKGMRLWEAPGDFSWASAAFSSDSNNVLIANVPGGQVERRDGWSGSVISKGGSPVRMSHLYPWNAGGSADWQTFLSPMGGSRRLRKVNPWRNDSVDFEVALRYGNYACALIPPGKYFASAGRVSPGSGVLEIRNHSSGELSRSLPFMGQVLTQESAPKICAKENALAVRFRKTLKVWRLENSKPNFRLDGGPRLGSSQRVASVSRRGQGYVVQVKDVSEKDPNKQLLSLTVSSPDLLYFTVPTREGDQFLVGSQSVWGAYRVGGAGLEELWPIKKVSTLGGCSFPAVHSADHRVWTGRKVLEFSTGRELVAVKDRRGLDWADSFVWVGSNRVAEIANANATTSDSGEVSEGAVYIALWDAESGDLVQKTKASQAVWLSASPDGAHIVEAGLDKRVRIRNGRTLEVEEEMRCHEEGLTGVVWHPTLPLLVTQARDGLIRVWDLKSFKMLEEFTNSSHLATRGQDKFLFRLEITADGRELNVYRDATILVYRPESFGGRP